MNFITKTDIELNANGFFVRFCAGSIYIYNLRQEDKKKTVWGAIIMLSTSTGEENKRFIEMWHLSFHQHKPYAVHGIQINFPIFKTLHTHTHKRNPKFRDSMQMILKSKQFTVTFVSDSAATDIWWKTDSIMLVRCNLSGDVAMISAISHSDFYSIHHECGRKLLPDVFI